MEKEQLIKEVENKLEQVKHELLALVLSVESKPIPVPEKPGIEPMVTAEVAAEHIHMTERQIRQMVADNYKNIPYYRPSERVLRFKLSELDAWSKQNANQKRLRAAS
jgi:hypothetical protein